MSGIPNHNSFFSSDTKGSFLSQFLKKELLQKKIKVFSIHLLLSTLLISSFFLFAMYYWFPHSSLELSGIKDVLLIILLADLVLGPALTFLVFNPIKKSLKFDLSVILVLQFSMFIYGAYTVYIAHPVYITFTIDRFTLVSARDASPLNAEFDEYKIPKYAKAVYAYVESPKTIEERNELLFNSVKGGLDLDAYSQYYLPYEKNIEKIISKGWDSEKIFSTNKLKEELSSFMKDNKLEQDDVVFLPAQGKAKFMTYVVDKKTAKPIGVFDIDPWASQEK